MFEGVGTLEQQRLWLQAEIDSSKSQAERNRLGQFATPTGLAVDILSYGASLLESVRAVRFLDPAFGTGAFYSALQEVVPADQIAEAVGFEIDAQYAEPAQRLWGASGLVLNLSDFTNVEPSPRFNLVICNPPYVRHHHLEEGYKSRLQFRSHKASGMKLSGLSGLYCHFFGLAHAWMAEGAIAGWLIPSEFMDVNYGRVLKQYLLSKVTLLHIHRFDPNDVQFADALVSSAVVWFRNVPPSDGHSVRFSFGGTLLDPKMSRTVTAAALARETKWTRFPVAEVRVQSGAPRLADFFQIKRGLATGDNSYFILPEEDIHTRGLPLEAFSPILPSPRYLVNDEIEAYQSGNPKIDRQLFLLDTRLSEDEIKNRYPSLWEYLEEGKGRGLQERYLCKHRAPWYSQENRPAPPIVCTYLGRGDTKRGRPFRFILNNSRATVANVYLAMYPTPQLSRALVQDPTLIRRIWEVLNQLTPEQLLGEGRVYGGGLHKLEPRELGNVDASTISALIPEFQAQSGANQMET